MWDDDDDDYSYGDDEESPGLGPCCVCGKEDETVRNLYALDKRAPVPGTGWGCFQCGLPSDGAMAVVCDECHEKGAKLVYVIYGMAGDKGRMLRSELSDEDFKHDMSKHPEAEYGR